MVITVIANSKLKVLLQTVYFFVVSSGVVHCMWVSLEVH